MEWERKRAVGLAGEDRPSDHEGGDDGADPAGEGGQGKLMTYTGLVVRDV